MPATPDTRDLSPQRIAAEPGRLQSHRLQRIIDRSVVSTLAGAAVFSVLVTAAIIIVLGAETANFFRQDEASLAEFFGSARWSPLLGSEKHFGIWPLVCGTVLVAGIALLVSVPLGLITAVFLSEYAPARVRTFLKPALELLAGIPTVVYGFLALVLFTPALKILFDDMGSYNALSAGIAVGILIVPIVSSVSEDAMRAVPQGLRDGVYGLGGTRFDAAVKVVFPAALSGIVSAVLLAAARAIGETMVVALAAGSTPKVTLDPREEVQTMTGFMVQMALGDVSNFGVEYLSMYAVAAMLFLITLGFTLLGAHVRRRFREAYE